MPTTVNRVKMARKSPGACGSCGRVIEARESYRHWSFRHGGKRVRCMASACDPRPSDLTANEKLCRVYAARESLEDLTPTYVGREDVAEMLRQAAQEVEEVGDDYDDMADTQEEYFPGSQQVEEARENAEELHTWADLLGEIAGDIEELDLPETSDSVDPDKEVAGMVESALSEGPSL